MLKTQVKDLHANHCNNCKRISLLCKKSRNRRKTDSIQTPLHALLDANGALVCHHKKSRLEQVVEGFYNGISTAEVDTLAAETCAYMYLDLSWDVWLDPMILNRECPSD